MLMIIIIIQIVEKEFLGALEAPEPDVVLVSAIVLIDVMIVEANSVDGEFKVVQNLLEYVVVAVEEGVAEKEVVLLVLVVVVMVHDAKKFEQLL